jgi:cytochrome c5
MAEQNEQCGGLCASPIVVAVAVAATIALPAGGYFAAKLLGGKPPGGQDEEAVLRRIQPMAQVSLSGGAQPEPARTAAKPAGPATAAAASPPAAAPATTAGIGKKVYDSACVACHASGVAGAPKFGDRAAWGPRLAGGLDALTASAIKGKGAMPPKGGNTSIPDADIRAAVEHMAAAAK